MRAESALAHGEQEKTGMFEVPPLCENESDDAPNGSYDLISSFGTYTNQKPHRVSLKKLGWINGVNPLPGSALAGLISHIARCLTHTVITHRDYCV